MPHFLLMFIDCNFNWNLLVLKMSFVFLVLMWIANNLKHFTRTDGKTNERKKCQRYRIFLTCIFECKLKWYIEMFVCIPFLFMLPDFCLLLFFFVRLFISNAHCVFCVSLGWVSFRTQTYTHSLLLVYQSICLNCCCCCCSFRHTHTMAN